MIWIEAGSKLVRYSALTCDRNVSVAPDRTGDFVRRTVHDVPTRLPLPTCIGNGIGENSARVFRESLTRLFEAP